MAQCKCGHTQNSEGNCDGTHKTLKDTNEESN